ncbi:hypothetical protein NCS57_01425900 [Fusarium keratoplasticum]|uniref:Uncharacterized protein n=1 Tax=Fusarium keratoplasticum TaxID=1328300 RepID=A0ACC0QDE3_9HYPO|nr:hypothetical protein NCS57_01425900 [Fusarium keratoplasticum]KAI8650906.1 hypothetical protein NCS57_01425900 [Fusarium keratoplasticum]
MASWISTESKKGLLPPDPRIKAYRRLFISQDFDHVFLTIAEFDDQYVQYVRGPVDEPKGDEPTGDGPKGDLPPLPELTTPKKRGAQVTGIHGTAISNGGNRGVSDDPHRRSSSDPHRQATNYSNGGPTNGSKEECI